MKKNEVFSLCLNIVVFLLEALGFYMAFSQGRYDFQTYTYDSNLLSLLASLLFVIMMIIKKSQKELPSFVVFLRFLATATLAVTLIVVLSVLPLTMEGTYFENLLMLVSGIDFLCFHLLCPLLSILSFVFFEGDRRLNKKKTIWIGMAPTLLYGTIVLILNLLKVMAGPYPFLMVYAQPIYVVLLGILSVLIVSYLLARYLLIGNQMHARR